MWPVSTRTASTCWKCVSYHAFKLPDHSIILDKGISAIDIRGKCSIHLMHVNDKIIMGNYISKKCLSIILMGRPDELWYGSMCLLGFMRFISDRTDSNADSTLDVSSADVSMYIMPFSAAQNKRWRVSRKAARELSAILFKQRMVGSERTGKLRSYFCGDDAKCFKVRFIPNDHGDDMWARVLA